jgi:ATP-dependent Lon protease
VTGDGTVGLFRIEVSVSSGTGKFKPAGGVKGSMKESIQRAFSFMQANKSALGITREMDTSDFHVEVIDLMGNKVEAELGVGFFVASFSVLRKSVSLPGLVIMGDMSIQGKVLRRSAWNLQILM